MLRAPLPQISTSRRRSSLPLDKRDPRNPPCYLSQAHHSNFALDKGTYRRFKPLYYPQNLTKPHTNITSSCPLYSVRFRSSWLCQEFLFKRHHRGHFNYSYFTFKIFARKLLTIFIINLYLRF